MQQRKPLNNAPFKSEEKWFCFFDSELNISHLNFRAKNYVLFGLFICSQYTLQGHLGSHLRCYQNRQQHSFWISFSETPDFSLKFRPEKLATTQRVFGYILWRKKKLNFVVAFFNMTSKVHKKVQKRCLTKLGLKLSIISAT